MIPNWLKLVKAWRRSVGHRHGGLTLEFLCAACGMQPRELLCQVYTYAIPITYCGVLRSPLIGYGENGKRGFFFDDDVAWHLKRWLINIGDHLPGRWSEEEQYEILLAYVHAQLADGTPSRSRESDRWDAEWSNTPFSRKDITFIRKVLGHNPPEILGVSRTGRIEYAPVG